VSSEEINVFVLFVIGHSFTEARSPHACYINPKGQAGTGTISVGGCW
jgi:hypothetical protein